jgi:DNA-binding protein HU-beta
MVKSTLIEVLAAKCSILPDRSERYLNALIEIIYDTLKADGRVKISGFGTFDVTHRKARLGVNPRQPTQKITIPAVNTPHFTPGEQFKKQVNK